MSDKAIEQKMASLAMGLKQNAPIFSAIGDSNRQAILITLLQNFGRLS